MATKNNGREKLKAKSEKTKMSSTKRLVWAFLTFNFSLFTSLTASAQAPDTAALPHAEFLALVEQFHPVARQAALNPERARQDIRQARGAFDPSVNAKYYGKQFKGTEYFHDWETYLRIPTWFGVDVKAGWDRGTGPYVNPQEYTATGGLSYVGLSVPLGQGMLVDERRTALRVAQALVGLAEAERRAVRNKLLLSASKDYWEWALATERLRLLTVNEQVAAVRFAATRQRVLAGDVAAIDSVEAQAELQNRQSQRVAARVQWQNATLVASSYLWDAQGRPRELPPTARPQALLPAQAWRPLTPDTLEILAAQAQQRHPDLLKTRVKQVQLGLENRLLLNKLLPKFNVDYNLLLPGRPFALENNPQPFQSGYSVNNYKLGLSLAQPILLRAERAKRQLNQIKLRDAGFQLDNDQRQVGNALQTAANDWQALLEQLRLQQQATANYQRLRDGELIRFDNGESTVFFINSREASLLSARQKLAELQAKYAQTQAQVRYAAGSD
jgi:outer membrane protein TolC